MEIQCVECRSNSNIAVLHAGPAPLAIPAVTEPASDRVGKQERWGTHVPTSALSTQMLDDQSNKSLTRSFFDIFGIPKNSSPPISEDCRSVIGDREKSKQFFFFICLLSIDDT